MQCEYYALEGLSDLVGTIKRVRAHLNPQLEIAGLLRTMYDPRNTLSQQVSQQLEQHFGDKVYRTLVPRNVRLAEAPSYGVPAVLWDQASKGAQAYVALADEILADRRTMNPHDEAQGTRTRARRAARRAMRLRRATRSLRCRSARIRPGKYQPRTKMDQQALAELAASIRSQGLMQPLLVRPVDRDRYELIAGERRWRAAQMAGLEEVPALVREVPDDAALAMSLIENIQRENLNPMEEAAGVQRLVDEFRMTHEQAADAVGRSRSATTNLLRLLKLARPVQEMVMEGALDMGHARALLALDGARQIEAAHRVAAKGLSVRDTEALVADACCAARAAAASAREADRDLARLEEEVSERARHHGGDPRRRKKGSGKLVVHYSSLDHLDELAEEAARMSNAD